MEKGSVATPALSSDNPSIRTRLDKINWRYFLIQGDRLLVDNFYERNGCIECEIFPLADLPNDFISAADRGRFGIRRVGGVSVFLFELPGGAPTHTASGLSDGFAVLQATLIEIRDELRHQRRGSLAMQAQA